MTNQEIAIGQFKELLKDGNHILIRCHEQWVHPLVFNGGLLGLGLSYNTALEEFNAGNRSTKPVKEDFIPSWLESELTHVQLYKKGEDQLYRPITDKCSAIDRLALSIYGRKK